MDLGVTDKVKPLIDKVRQMEILLHLKTLAKERGLWNFWLTDSEKGYG